MKHCHRPHRYDACFLFFRENPLKEWSPRLAQAKHPKLLASAQTVFQADKLFDKIQRYQTEEDQRNEAVSQLHKELAVWIGMLPPSMERIHIRNELLPRNSIRTKTWPHPQRYSNVNIVKLHDETSRENNHARKVVSSEYEENIQLLNEQAKDFSLELSFRLSADSVPMEVLVIEGVLEEWIRSKLSQGRMSPWDRLNHRENSNSLIELLEDRRISSRRVSRANPRDQTLSLPLLLLEDTELLRILELARRHEQFIEVSGGHPLIHENLAAFYKLRNSDNYYEQIHAFYSQIDKLGLYYQLLTPRIPSYMHHSHPPYGLREGIKLDGVLPVAYLKDYFLPFNQRINSQALTNLPESVRPQVDKALAKQSESKESRSSQAGHREGRNANEENIPLPDSAESFELLDKGPENSVNFSVSEDESIEPPAIQTTEELVEELIELKRYYQDLNDLEELLNAQLPTLLATYADQPDRKRSWERVIEQPNEARHLFSPSNFYQIISEKNGAVIPLLTMVSLKGVLMDLEKRIQAAEHAIKENLQDPEKREELFEFSSSKTSNRLDQINKLRRQLLAVSQIEIRDFEKEQIFAKIQHFHNLWKKQSEKLVPLRKATNEVFTDVEKTDFADLIDIWNSLERNEESGHGKKIYRGLDLLRRMPEQIASMFYPQPTRQIRIPHFLSKNSVAPEERVRRLIEEQDESMPPLPDEIPAPHEFLVSPSHSSLSALQRIWYAYFFAFGEESEALLFEKKLLELQQSEARLSLSQALEAAHLLQKLPKSYWSTLSHLRAESDNSSSTQRSSRNYRTQNFYEQVTLSYRTTLSKSFRGFVVYDGRVKLPSPDQINSNSKLLLPSLESVFEFYSEDELNSLSRIRRLKRLSTGFLPSTSIEQADWKAIRGLAARGSAARVFLSPRAQMTIQLGENVELQRLYWRICEQLSFLIDPALNTDDEAIFSWLYTNISAGLPNTSQLYVSHVNEMNADEKQQKFKQVDRAP